MARFYRIFFMPSTVVADMKFDANACTLRVIFISGKIYDYQKVPESVYEEMKRAKSKGTYLNEHIKGNYSFIKIK